jgi:hypothetical protein
VVHFIHRARVADDVLDETLEILSARKSDPATAMDIESRVPPTQLHPQTLGRLKLFFEPLTRSDTYSATVSADAAFG